MTQPPPHPDDLREARAADRLNAWLDGADPSPAPDPGPTARAVDRIAQSGLPVDAIHRHEHTLWETLMDQHTAPNPIPVATPTMPLSRGPIPVRPEPLRRAGSRVMGLVATLTLVTLVGLSALAVYLSSPQPGADPTMTLAAFGGAERASPTARIEPVPTQVRPDATPVLDDPPLWTLPPVTAYDLPTLEILGSGWNPLEGSHYLYTLDGTNVQAESHTYVDNQGNRVRMIVAWFPEYGSIDVARGWAQREISIYQDTLYPRGGGPDEAAITRPIDGCAELYRTEGVEWVTSFPTFATGCFGDDGRMMVFVSVSGNVFLSDAGSEYLRNPADGIVAAILGSTEAEATPTAGT